MEHFLCFQVLVSLKPKFSLLVSAAVLADAADATVVLIQKLRTWQMEMICTWDWQLDWSNLRHSTFTTKQEISWQKLARLYSRENDLYQLLQCGGWHDLLPLAVVL